MNIPNIPNDRRVVDKNGMLTGVWASFFSNLITQLYSNLSSEGYVLPRQSSSNISLLNVPENQSRILWNEDTERAMVNNDGEFKEILTT